MRPSKSKFMRIISILILGLVPMSSSSSQIAMRIEDGNDISKQQYEHHSINKNRDLQVGCLLKKDGKFDCLVDKITNTVTDTLEKDSNLSSDDNIVSVTIDEGTPEPVRSKKGRLEDVHHENNENEKDITVDLNIDALNQAKKESERSKLPRLVPHGNLRGNDNFKNEYISMDFDKINVDESEANLFEQPTSTELPYPTMSPTNPLGKAQEMPCLFSQADTSCHNRLTSDTEISERKFFYGDYMCSSNKQYRFGMTFDGYLSICHGNRRTWYVGPFIGPNPYSEFQIDGSLVVNNVEDKSRFDHKVLWTTPTDQFPLSSLELLNDGTLQIISSSRQIVWEIDPTMDSSIFISFSPTTAPNKIGVETNQLPTIESPEHETYHPGKLFYNEELDLFLSEGLRGRIVATAGQNLFLSNGQLSSTVFHDEPVKAGCFPSLDGGWYYLSNSQGRIVNGRRQSGGVGRIEFDEHGGIRDYKMLLEGTIGNGGSGITPWDTFISCEKQDKGQCWEVHPEEHWKPKVTNLGGKKGGQFESVAFDSRDMSKLKGFVTTDASNGALLRFSPNSVVLERANREGDYSDVLHKDGTLEFLKLLPETKTFEWTENKNIGEISAQRFYPHSVGLDVHDGFLYFVSKTNLELFVLDLDLFTYISSTTMKLEQMKRLLSGLDSESDGLLYLSRNGNDGPAGIYVHDHNDQYLPVIETGISSSTEATGLAFCDDGKRMMFAFADQGIVYEITLDDGNPFQGEAVNIRLGFR